MTDKIKSKLITALHIRLKDFNVKPNSEKGKDMAADFMVGAMIALDDVDPSLFITISSGRVVTEEFKHLIIEK